MTWQLLNLSYILDVISVYGERALVSGVPRSLGTKAVQVAEFPFVAAAACCMFNGQVNLGNTRSEQVIGNSRLQLPSRMRKRQETLQAYVNLRGQGNAWQPLRRRMDQSDSC